MRTATPAAAQAMMTVLEVPLEPDAGFSVLASASAVDVAVVAVVPVFVDLVFEPAKVYLGLAPFGGERMLSSYLILPSPSAAQWEASMKSCWKGP